MGDLMVDFPIGRQGLVIQYRLFLLRHSSSMKMSFLPYRAWIVQRAIFASAISEPGLAIGSNTSKCPSSLTLKTRGLSLGFVLSQPPGGGGTNPMAPMSVAIDYRPERIVLLSDGEFDPTCSATITMMNKQYGKSARIDCVGLMENVLVLRDIAALNSGTYYQAW